MAGDRVSTYPETIQAAVRDRLVAAAGFPAACVFLVNDARRPPGAHPSLQYATVALPTFARDPESLPFDDPPAEIDWCNAEIAVSLWVQCQLDPDGHADALTADRANGVAGVLRKAAAALNDFDPVDDGADDFILKASLTFLDSRREEQDRAGLRDWVRNELRFACQFVWNLSEPPGAFAPGGVYFPDPFWQTGFMGELSVE